MSLGAGELSEQPKTDLPRITLVFGDEPLLVEETADAVRSRALQLDYNERLVMAAEVGFDWGQLTETTLSMSLFSARRLIDLRLPTGKPGDAGSQALIRYCESPIPDTAMLVVCGRLDTRAKQAKWFKAVDRAGVVVEHKPIAAAQLPAWIRSRVHAKGMDIEREAITLLAHYLEGNLLAAAQEIDKLVLLAAEGGIIRYTDVEDSITDNARFNVFALTDHCLAGDAAKALRSLNGLRQEGVEPVLIVWALAKQVRTLYCLATGMAAGQPKTQLFKTFRIWAKQAPLVTAALSRFGQHGCVCLLQKMAHLDKVLKGRETGNIWQALEHACLSVCGTDVVGVSNQ